MCASPTGTNRQLKINSRFLPYIDKILIAGLRNGPAGKREAINKILHLVQEWKRVDCWRRIRRLRRSLPVEGFGPPKSQPRYTSGRCQLPVRVSRPWTAEEDNCLLNWAGYDPVNKIAERLGRSIRAVRFRLCALGMSAKVSDGWSLTELRKLLRMSFAKVRQLMGTGMLRVRDPRVTTESILALCSNNGLPLDHAASGRITELLNGLDACNWERAADLLGLTLEQVQVLICKGKLKVLDPFVTDRSFEEFCRKHGDQINLHLMDPDTAKWLEKEYGVLKGNARPVSGRQRHALVVRECKCGRKIAGNSFSRHLRSCAVAKGRSINAGEAA